MFFGIISCEMDLEKCNEAFAGLRFLLVEPQHDVDWKGPVIAVDTIGAEVGDYVVAALAPFGPKLNVPEDLPLEAAVIAVVDSITALSDDDEEEQTEEQEEPRSRERSPHRGREERSERRGPRRGAGRGRGRDSERERPREARRDDRGRRADQSSDVKPDSKPKARPPEREQEKPADPPRQTPPKQTTPKQTTPKPAAQERAPAEKKDTGGKRGEAAGSDAGLGIVWDSPSQGEGSSVKGKPPRRRR